MSDERYRIQPGDHFGRPAPVRELSDEYLTHEEYESALLRGQAREAERARREAKRDADRAEQGLRQIVVVGADEITPEPTRWLWTPYGDSGMPMGDLSVLVGKGGAAKSQILCWFCSKVSMGELEGCMHGTPRNVIYLYKEDSVARTIVPRLMASGADLKRVMFLRMTFLDDPNAQVKLPGDLDLLAAKIRELNAALVVYDPLSSHLEVRDSNSASVMRGVYERVRQMHEDTDTLGLGLGHIRKQPAGSLLDAFMGSSEQGNVVRNGWGVCERIDADPGAPSEYILSQEKNNLAVRATSLTYTIEGTTVHHDNRALSTSRVVFTGQTQESVSDLLGDQMQPGQGSKIELAVTWLRDTLQGKGEVPTRDVMNGAEDNKINSRTLRRAAARLNIIYNKYGSPGYYTYTWKLP
jgi:hypothetical protein